MRVFLDYLSSTVYIYSRTSTCVHLLAYINKYASRLYIVDAYEYASHSYLVDAYGYAWMHMSTHLVHVTACNNQLEHLTQTLMKRI